MIYFDRNKREYVIRSVENALISSVTISDKHISLNFIDWTVKPIIHELEHQKSYRFKVDINVRFIGEFNTTITIKNFTEQLVNIVGDIQYVSLESSVIFYDCKMLRRVTLRNNIEALSFRNCRVMTLGRDLLKRVHVNMLEIDNESNVSTMSSLHVGTTFYNSPQLPYHIDNTIIDTFIQQKAYNQMTSMVISSCYTLGIKECMYVFKSGVNFDVEISLDSFCDYLTDDMINYLVAETI